MTKKSYHNHRKCNTHFFLLFLFSQPLLGLRALEVGLVDEEAERHVEHDHGRDGRDHVHGHRLAAVIPGSLQQNDLYQMTFDLE